LPRAARPVFITRLMCAALSSPENGAGVKNRSASIAWLRRARIISCVVGTGVVAYLQLKSDPSLSDVSIVPRTLVRFFDTRDFLKNMLGFGGFIAVVHFAFAGFRREPAVRVAGRAVVVVVAVAILEIAQIWLPARSCDWHDVAAAALGIGLVSLLWLRHGAPDSSHET
jgi:hypothetical protein